MSADNWALCPQCKKTEEENAEKRVLKAQKSYGKVPAEEYLRLRTEAEVRPQLQQTFREDYHIGVNEDGEFEVDYSGQCSLCRCKFQFNHKVSILSAK